MSLRDLPEYVERASDVVWRPPTIDPDVDVYGFVLPADPVALDRLLDRDLNEPSFGAVNYRAAFGSVVVLVGEFHRMTAADPPDAGLGYLSYRETGIWCLALDTYNHRLVWYVPYLFADAGETIAGGREIYGYPKKLGQFDSEYPRCILEGGRTTVTSDALKVYGPDEQMRPCPMVSIDARPLPGDPPAGELDDFVDMFRGQLRLTPGTAYGRAPAQSATIAGTDDPPPGGSRARPPWTRRVLDAIEGFDEIVDQEALIVAMIDNPTLVFLKQFRDIHCKGKACYQAVTEAQFRVSPPLSFGRLPCENYRITVHDWASQPIASDLGLAADAALEPGYVFWASMSIWTGLGIEVWRAPT